MEGNFLPLRYNSFSPPYRKKKSKNSQEFPHEQLGLGDLEKTKNICPLGKILLWGEKPHFLPPTTKIKEIFF